MLYFRYREAVSYCRLQYGFCRILYVQGRNVRDSSFYGAHQRVDPRIGTDVIGYEFTVMSEYFMDAKGARLGRSPYVVWEAVSRTTRDAVARFARFVKFLLGDLTLRVGADYARGVVFIVRGRDPRRPTIRGDLVAYQLLRNCFREQADEALGPRLVCGVPCAWWHV